jgi:hypothetical protein
MRKFQLVAAILALAFFVPSVVDAQSKGGGKPNTRTEGGASKGKAAGTETREQLLAELKQKGVKFTEADVVEIGRDKTGLIVFLEKGNDKAGLQHILKRHSDEFKKRGIEANNLPKVLIRLVTLASAREKTTQKGSTGRVKGYTYNSKHFGKPIKVVVGANGFIVTAHPTTSATGEKKPPSGDKKSPPRKGTEKKGNSKANREEEARP